MVDDAHDDALTPEQVMIRDAAGKLRQALWTVKDDLVRCSWALAVVTELLETFGLQTIPTARARPTAWPPRTRVQ